MCGKFDEERRQFARNGLRLKSSAGPAFHLTHLRGYGSTLLDFRGSNGRHPLIRITSKSGGEWYN
jgi:hypothetical protein